MIFATYRQDTQLVTKEGLPLPPSGRLGFIWLNVVDPTEEEIKALRDTYGIDLRERNGAVVEDGDALYMQGMFAALDENGEPVFEPVMIVLNENVVATISHNAEFSGLKLGLQRVRRQLRYVHSSRAVLRLLLQSVNDTADKVVEYIVTLLNDLGDYISEISDGYDDQGKELGVSDLTEALLTLNEVEELVARVLEAQIDLGRVARYLRGEIDKGTEAELLAFVDDLVADIAAVKEHALIEREKVRYLQNAVTSILNIKQSQIVKVFTIITAVFLPPTLVATFYGMNFTHMPELSWKHGFAFSIILTLVSALLPMVYIKKKGWLR